METSHRAELDWLARPLRRSSPVKYLCVLMTCDFSSTVRSSLRSGGPETALNVTGSVPVRRTAPLRGQTAESIGGAPLRVKVPSLLPMQIRTEASRSAPEIGIWWQEDAAREA